MNKKEEIPCVFYHYIHHMLKEKYGTATVLSTKDAMKFLFEWRIPTSIRPVVIKELEILNLVERVNKKSIRVKDSKFTLEDVREFNKAVGIY